MDNNTEYLSATKYGELLNVDNRTIYRYMISNGFLDEGLKITSAGYRAGLIYRKFKTPENETKEYVAYPEGLINVDAILKMQ